MCHIIKSLGVLIFASLLLILPSVSTAQIPDTFDNLEVLPEDIKKGDLVGKMRNMTLDLGTRCWYCHVGEGNDLTTFDFASDEKPTKRIARLMIQMVDEVNDKTIKQVHDEKAEGEMGNENLMVTCYTCHSGETRPVAKRPEKE